MKGKRILKLPGLVARVFVLCLLATPSLVWGQAQDEQAVMPLEAYKLGPADLLEIFVWREEDLTKNVVVRPDGGISFPLAGELVVAGKTVSQVQEELTEKIQAYIPEAVVTVAVIEVASYRIYILGKVKNPGEYVLGNYVTVAQALTMADGLTPYAVESEIKVIRRQGDRDIILPFDHSKFMEGKNLKQNIMLRSGDTVVVP
jgi:polysaccharide export outer membrane protein